jgi:hypothetical protein
MLLKQTEECLGSTFSSTHLAHVLKTLSYAIGNSTSSYSMGPSPNDPPRLFHSSTIKLKNLLVMLKLLIIYAQELDAGRKIDLVLTILLYK